jgi:Cu(I)/Ag(I) efflux system membrane fusion protein
VRLETARLEAELQTDWTRRGNMKKAIALIFISFIAGIALTALFLTNPFGWGWVATAQHQVCSRLGVASPSAQAEKKQLWTCGMHPQVVRDKPGDCPICGMALVPLKDPQASNERPTGERRIKYWRAPMDPNYISDKPGKSPMGMDLVPVYEDEAETPAAGTVKIDPAFVQNIGVQSIAVQRTDIPFTIRTVGNLTYDEQQLTWVTTKYEGWIEKVRVNYVGEPVRKGQTLFEIYSPQLVTTQQEYLDALDYAEKMRQSKYPEIAARARSLLESSRKRLGYWDITDEQIRELEKTHQSRRTLAVFSPVNGQVVDKMNEALEGMYVKPGMNLYRLVDLSKIWVQADIFESQVPWLKLGQKALIELAYEPGREHWGTVRYIKPALSQKTHTLAVSIELPNPGQKLRADMYADVTFQVPSVRNVLAVPENAVIPTGTRNIVVLDKGQGTFQVKEVTLGVNGKDLWEVKDGVKEGDRVVVSAQFLIDSESNLKEAIQSLTSGHESHQAKNENRVPHG